MIRPDGTQVAYATLRNGGRAGNYDIVTAQLDGRLGLLFCGGDRARQQLTEGGVSQSEPAWSPDGTRLAFPGELDGVLYVVGTDGSNLRQVAERTTGWSVQRSRLAWSPDGRRIAFMRDEEGESGSTDLYVVDVEGRARIARRPRVRASGLVARRRRLMTRVLVLEGPDSELVTETGSALRGTGRDGDESSPWDGLSSPPAVFTVVAAVALVPIVLIAYAMWLRWRVQREGRRRQN